MPQHDELQRREAERRWRRRLREARAEWRPDLRRALAAEALTDPLISPAARQRARWELAFAGIQLAHSGSPEQGDGRAPEAERVLEELERDRPLTGGGRMALLRAGLSLVEGDLDAARPHVSEALDGRLAHDDRVWLWLAYAGAVSARGGRRAEAHYRRALTLATGAAVPEVRRRLALHHAHHGRLDRALAACPDDLTRAELELRRGAPHAALAVLSHASGAHAATLRVRALLAAGRPQDALVDGGSAGMCELRGEVRAALLDAPGALEDFEQAAARWRALGAPEAVCRSRVRGAALLLQLGRLGDARAWLDRARPAGVAPGGDAWARRALAESELLRRRGEAARAAEVVHDGLAALRAAGRPPHAFVAAALQGIAVTAGDAQDPFVRVLCGALSRVTPPAARLAALSGIERCPELSGADSLRARVRRLVPSPAHAAQRYAGLPAQDVALLARRYAELDRVSRRAPRMTARRRNLERPLPAPR